MTIGRNLDLENKIFEIIKDRLNSINPVNQSEVLDALYALSQSNINSLDLVDWIDNQRIKVQADYGFIKLMGLLRSPQNSIKEINTLEMRNEAREFIKKLLGDMVVQESLKNKSVIGTKEKAMGYLSTASSLADYMLPSHFTTPPPTLENSLSSLSSMWAAFWQHRTQNSQTSNTQNQLPAPIPTFSIRLEKP